MRIENTAGELGVHSNHSVAILDERCVRLLCEKPCHTSQRQRTLANVALAVAVVEANRAI